MSDFGLGCNSPLMDGHLQNSVTIFLCRAAAISLRMRRP